MQIKKHETVMIFIFFLICDQYIQRYLYHIATITESSAILGSIRWSGILFYICFLAGLSAIYNCVRKSFHGRLKKTLIFLSVGLILKFVLDKIFTNLLQIDTLFAKLLLPYHLYFFLGWIYFILLIALLFFVLDKSSFHFQKNKVQASVIVVSILIAVSVLIYWVETFSLEFCGRSIFFNFELPESGKQTIFNAIQQKFFTIIICPSLLILLFKFTDSNPEGGKDG